jgi:MFS family permease
MNQKKRIDLSWITGTQLLILLGFGLFIGSGTWETALVVELTKVFQVRDSDIGRLMALQAGLVVLLGLLGGYLSDRMRRTWLWASGYCLVALSSLLIAIGIRLHIDFSLFLALKLLAGLGLGITSPLPFIMLIDAAPAQKRNLMFGLLMVIGAMGGGLGQLVPSLCLGLKNGLEIAYMGFGVIMLLSSLLLAFAKDPKRGAQDACLKDVLADDCAEYDYHLRLGDIKAIAAKPINLLIASYNALIYIPTSFISAWLITHLVRKYNMSELHATLALFVGFSGALIGSMIGGILADKPRLSDGKGRVSIAMVSAALALPLYFVSFIQLWPWMVVALLLFSANVCNNTANPAMASLIQEVNLPEHRGVWTALNGIVVGVANMFCLWAPPLLAEALGGNYARPFMLAALLICPLSIGLLIMIRRRIQRDIGGLNAVLAERAAQVKARLSESNTLGHNGLGAGEEMPA